MQASIRSIIVSLLFICRALVCAQTGQVIVKGQVTDAEGKFPIEQVGIKLSNQFSGAYTDKSGRFVLILAQREIYTLVFFHTAYQSLAKTLKTSGKDTVLVNISLHHKPNYLDTVAVIAKHEPETLVGKPNYSIFDFDFYEDKLLLLTAERSLQQAQVRLADYDGKIFSSFDLPKRAGPASQFFHDFEGYTEVLCKDSIFRLDVWGNSLEARTVDRSSFNKYLKPISDTLNGNYYVQNQWDKYPSFDHYYINSRDTVARILNTISNADLMKIYNHEYYYLPSRMQLEARRIANYYKTDVHIVAALMSGFTQSAFYEALYAPLFILNDTICIFNHYSDYVYHYNKNNVIIDSVKINYHHPKNWREWKKQLFVDEAQNTVYAFFSRNGHHYIKQINHHTGKDVFTYKLKHHSAEKIKIRDGFVYYVYRPFGSTQERFLYRERIEAN